ncbi:MAG: NTP transferase domain-containing protein [Eubacterium aggregans]
MILAAGQGTRMVSKNPKVLHRACGETLLGHVIRANQGARVSDIAVIVGFQAEEVKKSLPGGVQTFLQAEQLGTGHAVMQASAFLEDFEGNVGEGSLSQRNVI